MNKKVFIIARTGVMLALVLVLQYVGSLIGKAAFPGIGSTILVGSLVNFVLALSVFYCGIWGGLVIGMLTPVMALLIGQMGQPVLIPFIGIGNALFVAVLWASGKLPWGEWVRLVAGLIAASAIKFCWMCFGVVSLLPVLGIPEKAIPTLTVNFGLLQLWAALIGGTLAVLVKKALVRSGIKEEHDLASKQTPQGSEAEQPVESDKK